MVSKFPTEKVIGAGIAIGGLWLLIQGAGNMQKAAQGTGSIGGSEQTQTPTAIYYESSSQGGSSPGDLPGGATNPGLYEISQNPYDPYADLQMQSSSPVQGGLSIGVEDLSGYGYENPYTLQSMIIPEGTKVYYDQNTGEILGYEDPVAMQSRIGNPFSDPEFLQPYVTPVAQKQTTAESLSGTGRSPIYDEGGNVVGYQDYETQQSVLASSLESKDVPTGLLGSGVTASQFALGATGLSSSYFTAAGETIAQKPQQGVSLLKATQKTGLESIPIIGEQAASVVSSTGGGVAKRGLKTGIGLIPLVGTVAGAEFDVAVNEKDRPTAYLANIVGDILGGLGAIIGAPLGGVGGVAGGVGGQIAGETAVYSIADALRAAATGTPGPVKTSTFNAPAPSTGQSIYTGSPTRGSSYTPSTKPAFTSTPSYTPSPAPAPAPSVSGGGTLYTPAVYTPNISTQYGPAYASPTGQIYYPNVTYPGGVTVSTGTGNAPVYSYSTSRGTYLKET